LLHRLGGAPAAGSGAGLAGVHYLRRIEQADALRGALVQGARLVVVGGGWIGLEVTAAAREHSATVMLVEVGPLPLQRVLGDELAQVFADLHAEHGVDLRLGTSVQEITASGGRVASVTLDDGTTVSADAVVVVVGITPAVNIAQAAGLAVDNGVLVDAAPRTRDPDIYAAGDVAKAYNPLLGRRSGSSTGPTRCTAAQPPPAPCSARRSASTVCRTSSPTSTTSEWSTPAGGGRPAGRPLRAPATPNPPLRPGVVFRGDVPRREFVAFWLADGTVLAGMNVNVWDVTDHIQRLVRSGSPIDPDRLTNPTVQLTGL
jgi:3-phenylpropionate/trans-cinnamate dioxygenase ferredoxin reductase subunit